MFIKDLTNKVTEYMDSIDELKGQIPSVMLIDFVVEKYKQHRNFPYAMTDDVIEQDLYNHMSTIAMAVVDLYSKLGAEGEISHTENGVTRQYENAYVSTSIFNDVLPYVNIF